MNKIAVIGVTIFGFDISNIHVTIHFVEMSLPFGIAQCYYSCLLQQLKQFGTHCNAFLHLLIEAM